MKLSDYAQKPRNHKHVWYYEERGGIDVIMKVQPGKNYVHGTIPWHLLRKSLSRRDVKVKP
jgi:hypothetical protein